MCRGRERRDEGKKKRSSGVRKAGRNIHIYVYIYMYILNVRTRRSVQYTPTTCHARLLLQHGNIRYLVKCIQFQLFRIPEQSWFYTVILITNSTEKAIQHTKKSIASRRKFLALNAKLSRADNISMQKSFTKRRRNKVQEFKHTIVFLLCRAKKKNGINYGD